MATSQNTYSPQQSINPIQNAYDSITSSSKPKGSTSQKKIGKVASPSPMSSSSPQPMNLPRKQSQGIIQPQYPQLSTASNINNRNAVKSEKQQLIDILSSSQKGLTTVQNKHRNENSAHSHQNTAHLKSQKLISTNPNPIIEKPSLDHFFSVSQMTTINPAQLISTQWKHMQNRVAQQQLSSKEISKNTAHSYSNSLSEKATKSGIPEAHSLFLTYQLADSPNYISQDGLEQTQRHQYQNIAQNNGYLQMIGLPSQTQKQSCASLDLPVKHNGSTTTDGKPYSNGNSLSSSMTHSHTSKHIKSTSPEITSVQKQNEYYEFVNLVSKQQSQPSKYNSKVQQSSVVLSQSSQSQQLHTHSSSNHCNINNYNNNNNNLQINNFTQPQVIPVTTTYSAGSQHQVSVPTSIQQLPQSTYKQKKDLTINTAQVHSTYSFPHDLLGSGSQTMTSSQQTQMILALQQQQLSLSNRPKTAKNHSESMKQYSQLLVKQTQGSIQNSQQTRQLDPFLSQIQQQQSATVKTLSPKYKQQVLKYEGQHQLMNQQQQSSGVGNTKIQPMLKNAQSLASGVQTNIKKSEKDNFFLSPKHPKSQPESTKNRSQQKMNELHGRNVKETNELNNVSSTQKQSKQIYSSTSGVQSQAAAMKKKLSSREAASHNQKVSSSNLKQSSTRDSSSYKLQNQDLQKLVHRAASMFVSFGKQREAWKEEKTLLQEELITLRQCLVYYEDNLPIY